MPWEPCGFVANLAEARALLHPEVNEPTLTGPLPKPLGSGTGKHRKPSVGRYFVDQHSVRSRTAHANGPGRDVRGRIGPLSGEETPGRSGNALCPRQDSNLRHPL
ncbi:DUF6087 family protein [Streptomyces sp. NPDC048281]|uniref:DUF6087 family protein n=1 Tax=Streptomyces sp. NPDC048281 TaxID=3154715 RepID=UPI0034475DF5